MMAVRRRAVASLSVQCLSCLRSAPPPGGGRESLCFDNVFIFSMVFYNSLLISSSPTNRDQTDAAGTPCVEPRRRIFLSVREMF